jgi:hypothetical protein
LRKSRSHEKLPHPTYPTSICLSCSQVETVKMEEVGAYN